MPFIALYTLHCIHTYMMYTLYYTLEVSGTAQIQGISLIISGKLVKGNIAPYKFYSVQMKQSLTNVWMNSNSQNLHNIVIFMFHKILLLCYTRQCSNIFRFINGSKKQNTISISIT